MKPFRLAFALGPLCALAFFGAWEAASRLLGIPRYLLPSPLDVASTLKNDASQLTAQALVTGQEWALGLALSVFTAFLICVACYGSRVLRGVLGPLLVASQAIPYLVFAPLLLLWFGLGLTPKVLLVMLTCTFPLAAVWLEALERARADYETLCAMLKMGPMRIFFSVSLPASLGGFFTGLKVSVSYAVVAATLAELIGSEAGLGVYIQRAQGSYRTDRVLAAVILVVALSLTSTALVEIIRRRVVFWEPRGPRR